MTATKWAVPRESQEWVGPIVVTVTVAGEPVVVDAGSVEFAVIRLGTRPVAGDWAAPVVEPGGTAIGVMTAPVDSYQRNGIWLRVTDIPEIPVMFVGELVRS